MVRPGPAGGGIINDSSSTGTDSTDSDTETSESVDDPSTTGQGTTQDPAGNTDTEESTEDGSGESGSGGSFDPSEQTLGTGGLGTTTGSESSNDNQTVDTVTDPDSGGSSPAGGDGGSGVGDSSESDVGSDTSGDSGQADSTRSLSTTGIGTTQGENIPEDAGQGIETESGREAEQAQQLEQEVVDELGSQYDESDVEITRDGDRLQAELTATGELTAERQARQQQRTALAGIGYEEDAGGQLSAPDAEGRETLAEERADERQARVETGLGVEESASGETSGPDAAGRQTLAEERADERQARVETGLGIEEDASGNTTAPDAPGTPGGQTGQKTDADTTTNGQRADGLRGAAYAFWDTGVDIAFQDEAAEEVAETIGLPESRQSDDIDISGPSVTLQEGDPGELNTDVTNRLTRGRGLISDDKSQELQQTARQRQEFFGVGAEVGSFVESVTGSETAGEFAHGVGSLPGQFAAAPAQIATTADIGVEAAVNLPGTIEDEGVGDTAVAVAETSGRVTQGLVESATENPARFTGQLAGEFATGAIAGKAIGSGSRAVRDRVRTAGGQKVDLDDVTSDSVRRNVETGGAEGDRFPGAQDAELYQDDPAAAVREQAEEFTNEDIEQTFQDAGVDDGVTLKKAIDVEPEGPERGRAAQGFQSAPGESLEEFDYETPGSFAGPELSPNFLRTGGRSSGFSLRPGLPDFGSNPTGVLVRTDVENPDAGNLDDFNREMIDRAGETTARTKPAGEVNVGEVEAVIPPGAEFSDVGGGRVRNLLRRAGVGSDFYTEVDGRRVPLRPVAPSDSLDNASTRADIEDGLDDVDETNVDAETQSGEPLQSRSGSDSDTKGGALESEQPARTFERRTLDEITSPRGSSVDRPVPTFLPSAGASAVSSSASSVAPSATSSPIGGGSATSGGSPVSQTGGAVSFGGSGFGRDGGAVTSLPGGGDGGSSGGGGGSPGGGGGSEGTPGGGGGSPSPQPSFGTPPSNNRKRDRPDTEGDSDDDGMLATIGGVRSTTVTDFVNPLTGEVLKTEGD